MPRTRRPAYDALLCERCGYDLAGLTRDDNCPECGKPIAESMPENRTGTPWQRGGLREWRRTALVILTKPKTSWNEVRNDPRRATELLFFNSLAAGGVIYPAVWLVTGPIGVIADQKSIGSAGLVLLAELIVFMIPSALICAVIVFLLTAIEVFGISHFGHRRGWRTDRDLARTICAHASFLWIPTGLFTGTAIGVGLMTGMLLIFAPAFLFGMLLFETWVYLGFRAMRYANPPGSERHLRDAGAGTVEHPGGDSVSGLGHD